MWSALRIIAGIVKHYINTEHLHCATLNQSVSSETNIPPAACNGTPWGVHNFAKQNQLQRIQTPLQSAIQWSRSTIHSSPPLTSNFMSKKFNSEENYIFTNTAGKLVLWGQKPIISSLRCKHESGNQRLNVQQHEVTEGAGRKETTGPFFSLHYAWVNQVLRTTCNFLYLLNLMNICCILYLTVSLLCHLQDVASLFPGWPSFGLLWIKQHMLNAQIWT